MRPLRLHGLPAERPRRPWPAARLGRMRDEDDNVQLRRDGRGKHEDQVTPYYTHDETCEHGRNWSMWCPECPPAVRPTRAPVSATKDFRTWEQIQAEDLTLCAKEARGDSMVTAQEFRDAAAQKRWLAQELGPVPGVAEALKDAERYDFAAEQAEQHEADLQRDHNAIQIWMSRADTAESKVAEQAEQLAAERLVVDVITQKQRQQIITLTAKAESAWLIEAGPEPHYWDGRGVDSSTIHHAEAVRFARFEDAERVRCWLVKGGQHWRSVQHSWSTPNQPNDEAAK